jgi:hypothetical protein
VTYCITLIADGEKAHSKNMWDMYMRSDAHSDMLAYPLSTRMQVLTYLLTTIVQPWDMESRFSMTSSTQFMCPCTVQHTPQNTSQSQAFNMSFVPSQILARDIHISHSGQVNVPSYYPRQQPSIPTNSKKSNHCIIVLDHRRISSSRDEGLIWRL